MKYPIASAFVLTALLAGCNNSDTQLMEPVTDTVSLEASLNDDADAPINGNTLSLEKIISPAEKAYAEQQAFYDIDPRLQPVVNMCGEPDGPYYPDYLLTTIGYQDKDTAAYKGSLFLQVASHSRGSISTETYFIPTETLIVEALETELRIASSQDNVSGVTSGFQSDGTAEETYDFEGVDLDRKIHCNKAVEATQLINAFISSLNAPVTKEIRYSVIIKSEVNLEGMCEYMHADAKATIVETLSDIGLTPIEQIAEAPNNDMLIRLTPLPSDGSHSQNDCRYDIDIVRNWTKEDWYATPARNQNYETGYELIFQSLFEVGEEYKALGN